MRLKCADHIHAKQNNMGQHETEQRHPCFEIILQLVRWNRFIQARAKRLNNDDQMMNRR